MKAAPARAVPTEAPTLCRTAPAEGHARPGKAPDNVYPLERSRETAARKPPAGGFDISVRLRPEPDRLPDVRIPAAGVPQAPVHPAALQERIQPTLREGPVRASAERNAASPAESVRDHTPWWRLAFRRRSRGEGSASRPRFPRAWHIAVVYLFLLFLSGFALLLIQIIASPNSSLR